MTAEEAIQAKLIQLQGRWGKNDNTVGSRIEILEWVLSLLKTDRMALAKELETIRQHEFNSTKHHTLTVLYLDNLIKSLESKSEMR